MLAWFYLFINLAELGQKNIYLVYFIFQILVLCIDMLGTSGKKTVICSSFLSIPLNLSWKAVRIIFYLYFNRSYCFGKKTSPVLCLGLHFAAG